MAICQKVPKLNAVGSKEQEGGAGVGGERQIESFHLREY